MTQQHVRPSPFCNRRDLWVLTWAGVCVCVFVHICGHEHVHGQWHGLGDACVSVWLYGRVGVWACGHVGTYVLTHIRGREGVGIWDWVLMRMWALWVWYQYGLGGCGVLCSCLCCPIFAFRLQSHDSLLYQSRNTQMSEFSKMAYVSIHTSAVYIVYL